MGGSTTISQVAPRPCQLPPHLLCSLVCQNFLKWFLSFWTPILHPPRPASPSPIRLWPPHSMVITFLRLFKDLMAISPPPHPVAPRLRGLRCGVPCLPWLRSRLPSSQCSDPSFWLDVSLLQNSISRFAPLLTVFQAPVLPLFSSPLTAGSLFFF